MNEIKKKLEGKKCYEEENVYEMYDEKKRISNWNKINETHFM